MMGSFSMRVSLESNDACANKSAVLRQTQREGSHVKTEEEIGDASTSQGMPKMASNHQLETKKDSSLEPSEGAWPCRHCASLPLVKFLKISLARPYCLNYYSFS